MYDRGILVITIELDYLKVPRTSGAVLLIFRYRYYFSKVPSASTAALLRSVVPTSGDNGLLLSSRSILI